GIAGPVPPDHLLGLGGSAETDGGGTVRFTTAAPVVFADVHYLAQPAGGTFSVLADGKLLAEVPTLRAHKESDFARVALPASTKQIELRAAGRVRLFGAALEAARGVVVDNLGVVNASVLGATANNLQEHWRTQLARRDADLVIVMLGTNEAEWLVPGTPGMVDHERRVGQLAATVRAAVPAASCLIVSPLDQVDYTAPGLPPRPSIPAIVDAQRRAATAAGCAFWDAYLWMGGAGASRTWFRGGLVANDFQHPTEAGSLRLAEALFAALVR
ncbi:MAG TPA: GDSL-type esterase/lipase family protein, partial [Kofleriaceae bacterium]|nr:GDSL-type esterase/lipase family protein [Kofleriaceae bacterium]